ncbi:lysylphosphatidylglycerol synthase transmembrane domain-containing protein [Denitratisoma sp. DHT3]|uniref:lysylphosphatidylglycerol synthase transmembrane domain-containing protein n=1 Tax=Denitratisoma sp. DHT3 TaxID=1981880 RepID=UPI0016469CDD|nr:lysylphosphatidylglycerol synthase domain-containing protein [Denitratisoma sp. DHT3]
MLPTLSLAFGLALIAALLGWIGTGAVVAGITRISLPAAAVVVALVAGATFLGAINTYQLLRIDNQIPPFHRYLPLYWFSWSLGLVLPGQIGDMAALSALLRKHDIPITRSLGRTLADKITSIIIFALAALPGIAALAVEFPLPIMQRGTAVIAAILSVCAISVTLVLLRNSLRLRHLIQLATEIPREITLLIRHHPIPLLNNLLLTLIKLLVTAAAYQAVLGAVSPIPPPSLTTVASLMSISALVAYVPVTFNGIGTAEITGVAVFGTVGLSAANVISAYLLLRLLVLAVAWIPSTVWLLTLAIGRKNAAG